MTSSININGLIIKVDNNNNVTINGRNVKYSDDNENVNGYGTKKTLHLKGDTVIDGDVKGDLNVDGYNVLLTIKGDVGGDITAANVKVENDVKGDINGAKVSVKGKVSGDINAASCTR